MTTENETAAAEAVPLPLPELAADRSGELEPARLSELASEPEEALPEEPDDGAGSAPPLSMAAGAMPSFQIPVNLRGRFPACVWAKKSPDGAYLCVFQVGPAGGVVWLQYPSLRAFQHWEMEYERVEDALAAAALIFAGGPPDDCTKEAEAARRRARKEKAAAGSTQPAAHGGKPRLTPEQLREHAAKRKARSRANAKRGALPWKHAAGVELALDWSTGVLVWLTPTGDREECSGGPYPDETTARKAAPAVFNKGPSPEILETMKAGAAS